MLPIKQSKTRLLYFWLLGAAGVAIMGVIFAYAMGKDIANVRHTTKLLTGNYLFDALFELAMTSPVIIVLALSTGLYVWKRSSNTPISTSVLVALGLFYTALSVIYIGSQLIAPILPFLYDETFKYIRASVGATFLAAVFSSIAYFRGAPPRWKYLLLLGIVLPILLIPIMPWSLELNGMSWRHFDD